MRSGRMDRLITFQETSGNSNDFGDAFDRSYSNLSTDPTSWAQMIPKSDSEKEESGKEASIGFVDWKIHYRSDITADMRIVWDSRNFYITGTREIGRQEGLLIETEERK